jgi:hypothetical protein
MSWKPAPRADLDLFAMSLDAQQGYLLSRLDGETDVEALAMVTGLPPERVTSMLEDLVALGAVQAGGSKAGTPRPEPAPNENQAESTEETAQVEEEPVETESPADAARIATHRQLFELELHHHTVDERVVAARLAEEPELSAYCFDPVPKVIQALLENPRAGLAQARLVAVHHRNAIGLEAVAARTAFANDIGVRRGLLQNPQLPASLFRRLWSSRRLLELFLVTSSRDAPEQTRHAARELLRACFVQRTGEERVELILNTEGRCLTSLAGLTIDGMTTALLCRRSYVSTILILNIARWSAAPPQLIAHLRRQDIVRRNAQLRTAIERHPNIG